MSLCHLNNFFVIVIVRRTILVSLCIICLYQVIIVLLCFLHQSHRIDCTRWQWYRLDTSSSVLMLISERLFWIVHCRVFSSLRFCDSDMLFLFITSLGRWYRIHWICTTKTLMPATPHYFVSLAYYFLLVLHCDVRYLPSYTQYIPNVCSLCTYLCTPNSPNSTTPTFLQM
jgi:hypothetical protein